MDAFNVINYPKLTSPNTSLSVNAPTGSKTANFATSSGFGQITGTQPNRKLQASARFFF